MDHQTTIETLMRRIALSTNDNETAAAVRALKAKLKTAGIDPHTLGVRVGEASDAAEPEKPKADQPASVVKRPYNWPRAIQMGFTVAVMYAVSYGVRALIHENTRPPAPQPTYSYTPPVPKASTSQTATYSAPIIAHPYAAPRPAVAPPEPDHCNWDWGHGNCGQYSRTR